MLREGDAEFLSRQDDKHLFSALKMLEIANGLGMRLTVHNVDRDFFKMSETILRRRRICSDDVDLIMQHIRRILPAGLMKTAANDYRATYVFHTRH